MVVFVEVVVGGGGGWGCNCGSAEESKGEEGGFHDVLLMGYETSVVV